MNNWLKRLLVLLTIPFLTLALTACPGPDDNGAGADQPAIEEELEDAGEDLEDAAEDTGQAIEEGAEDAAQAVEDAAEDAEEELE